MEECHSVVEKLAMRLIRSLVHGFAMGAWGCTSQGSDLGVSDWRSNPSDCINKCCTEAPRSLAGLGILDSSRHWFLVHHSTIPWPLRGRAILGNHHTSPADDCVLFMDADETTSERLDRAKPESKSIDPYRVSVLGSPVRLAAQMKSHRRRFVWYQPLYAD